MVLNGTLTYLQLQQPVLQATHEREAKEKPRHSVKAQRTQERVFIGVLSFVRLLLS